MSFLIPKISGARRYTKRSRGASVRSSVKKNTGRSSFVSLSIKIACTLLGVVGVVLVVGRTAEVYQSVSSQKIEHVRIEGSLDYVSKVELEIAVLSFMDQGLIALDLDQIKLELENNPWVKEVGIRREWPDILVINVTEKVAIARWSEERLLSQDGEVFAPLVSTNLTHLPALSGPEGSEREVMEQYHMFNQLLYPQGLRIAKVEMNQRHAWTLGLANGVEIKIGTNNVLDKVRRLIGVIDYLQVEEMENIETIDLRYTNGIAIDRRSVSVEEVVSL